MNIAVILMIDLELWSYSTLKTYVYVLFRYIAKLHDKIAYHVYIYTDSPYSLVVYIM